MTSIENLYSIYLKHPVICTDTRDIKKNAVFFALKGQNFNGNTFAEQALKEGCAYVVVDEEKYLPAGKNNEQYILVPNVLEALQQLANHHRRQLSVPVIAITGSNGKTTSKELLHAVLSKKYKTLATKGNFNNHIGVPLTLLSLEKTHQIAVVEMGANHQGEIALLCKIAEPNCVAITNIGKAHLEGFGSFEGVIKAKSEIYDFARANHGIAFVNSDNELLMKLSDDIERIVFGTSGNVDFGGIFIEADPFVKLKWKKITDLEDIENKAVINSQLIGKYNFENILMAISIGCYFGVTEEDIKESIENYIPSNNRSQVIKKGDNTLLMDAYNANPTSMKAAIENFSEMKADNKVLILGDMLELGDESLKEHQQIIDLIQTKKIAKTILVGKWFSKAVHSFGENKINAHMFQDTSLAMDWIKQNKISDAAVLIKGSRGITLEKIAEII